jgi:hypothetical protein
MKLAQMAKNRVKLADFSPNDRFNFIDLFVNNEKTLMRVYEALFPQRNSSVYPTLENTQRDSTKPVQQMYKSSFGFKNSGSGQVPTGDNQTNASSTYFNAYGSNAK